VQPPQLGFDSVDVTIIVQSVGAEATFGDASAHQVLGVDATDFNVGFELGEAGNALELTAPSLANEGEGRDTAGVGFAGVDSDFSESGGSGGGREEQDREGGKESALHGSYPP